MKYGKAIISGLAFVGCLVGFGSGSLRADTITYTVSGLNGSQTVAGTAVFTLTGNTLTIDLSSNTTLSNMMSTADLLTALEFNLAGGLSLSNGSATGQTVDVNNDLTLTTPTASGSLNTGWGGGNQAGNPDGWAAAAGLNIGSGQSFNGTALDGAGYGLITAFPTGPSGDVLPNSDGFVQNSPYTYGTVHLTFSVAGTGTLATDLSNVKFLYGTQPDATLAGTPSFGNNPSTPLPSAAWGGLVLIGLLGLNRKFRTRDD